MRHLGIHQVSVLLGLGLLAAAGNAVRAAGVSDGDIPVLRVAVDLVSMNVAVIDSKGRSVSGLRKEDFKLYQDDVEQPIDVFDSGQAPVSWELLLDRSESMAELFSETREVGRRMLKQLPSDDGLAFIPFHDRIEVIPNADMDRAAIGNAIEQLTATGGTALYDALALALDQSAMTPAGRRVIVLITDGQDENSRLKLQEVMERVEARGGAAIYILGMFDYQRRPWWERTRSRQQESIERDLKRLAEISGGTAYFPKNREESSRAIGAIFDDVRGQYALSFYQREREGADRRLNVRVEIAPGGKKKAGLFLHYLPVPARTRP